MAGDRHGGLEDLDPEVLNGDEPNDPAAVAFEALWNTVETLAVDLTREMMTIRRGVEHTLDQMERRGAPVDYSAELGRINQNQAAANKRLLGIEQSSVFKHGPEHYAACSSAVAKAWSGQLHCSSSGKRQNRWIMIAAFGGMLTGVVLTQFLPAVLPF